MQDKELKKEFDEIPDTDANGDPVYKIGSEMPTEKLPEIGEISNTADDSEFKDTPQDLKDENSQE